MNKAIGNSGPVDAPTSATYWEARARRYALEAAGLRAVCAYGMPWLYNAGIDWCQRRALAPWLNGSVGRSALDVGCGVGRWSLRLAKRGMRVTGIDLSPFMVTRAAQRAQEQGAACTFVAADLKHYRTDQRYDLVLCVTVLQHIVEPHEAAAAIANLAHHLARDGRLVLLEAAPSAATARCDTRLFRARTLDWYRTALAAAGLQVTAVRGVDPMPLKTLLLPHYKSLGWPLGPLAASAVAAASLPFDWLLGPRLAGPSWHKVIVASRSPETPHAH